jgi:hypothetical protein
MIEAEKTEAQSERMTSTILKFIFEFLFVLDCLVFFDEVEM